MIVRAASRLAARRCSTAAASSSATVPPPTREQLYRHAVCAAIPMIGFGACARNHLLPAHARHLLPAHARHVQPWPSG